MSRWKQCWIRHIIQQADLVIGACTWSFTCTRWRAIPGFRVNSSPSASPKRSEQRFVHAEKLSEFLRLSFSTGTTMYSPSDDEACIAYLFRSVLLIGTRGKSKSSNAQREKHRTRWKSEDLYNAVDRDPLTLIVRDALMFTARGRLSPHVLSSSSRRFFFLPIATEIPNLDGLRNSKAI